MRRKTELSHSEFAAALYSVTPRIVRQDSSAPLPQSITASGGICLPVEPFYEFALTSESRPVSSLLPKFSAKRGQIRFIKPRQKPRSTDLEFLNKS